MAPTKAKARGMGSEPYLRGRYWWIKYYVKGKVVRESSRSKAEGRSGLDARDAVALLRRRIAEIETNTYVGQRAGRLRMLGTNEPGKAGLRELLKAEYIATGRGSLIGAAQHFRHLAAFFGEDVLAVDLTGVGFVRYMAHRRLEGAFPGTIRNELSTIRKAFGVAMLSGAISARPVFPHIEVSNTRTGFFEEAEFQAVRSRLPEDLKPLAEFLYLCGWRSGEAKGLEWRQVDLVAGVARIERTKNGQAKTLPFHASPDLAALFQRQRARADAVQHDLGVIVTSVFFWSEDGSAIKSFQREWDAARKAAGVNRIVHDLRRTAARNLRRSGVPESVVMAICGWKTRAMFERYNIVNEQDMSAGLAKLGKLGAEVAAGPDKVAQLRTGTGRAHSRGRSGRDGSAGKE
jgi:integrase